MRFPGPCGGGEAAGRQDVACGPGLLRTECVAGGKQREDWEESIGQCWDVAFYDQFRSSFLEVDVCVFK